MVAQARRNLIAVKARAAVSQHRMVPMKSPKGGRARGTLKGRGVDPAAREEVRALLGAGARRADLLIEYLHRIQDRYGHLSAARLAALAAELKLAQAEVYEVATFYHHFDVVKEGEAPPPALTVRVCDSIACEMAGAAELLETLPAVLGKDVRVLHAPCVGRCEVAPCAVVHQNPIGHATVDSVRAAVQEKAVACPEPAYVDYAKYRKAGGYALLAECLAGKRTRDAVTKIMEDSGLRGLGGAGFPAGRKWRLVSPSPKPSPTMTPTSTRRWPPVAARRKPPPRLAIPTGWPASCAPSLASRAGKIASRRPPPPMRCSPCWAWARWTSSSCCPS
jgi:formate dehydrogenase